MVDLAGAALPIRRRWTPDTFAVGSFLHCSPPIFTCPPAPGEFGAIGYFAERFPETRFTFLMQLWWSHEAILDALALAVRCRRFRRANPASRLILLANTAKEEELLRRLGLEVRLAPQNMFIDETMFLPLPGHARSLDAVYNAQLAPFKRHHLARLVPSCGYLTFFPAKYPARVRRERLRSLLDGLPAGHRLLNRLEGDNVVRMTSHIEVNEAYASAHVGLCLSRVEGAMYASMEYLLAGLPVVSTKSRGGRDFFFHPETAIIVEDDPREVRDAVAALKARAIPPEAVRKTALDLVRRERERFNAFIEDLSGGRRIEGDPRWSFEYAHKLVSRDTTIAGLERHFLAGRDG